MKTEFKIGDLVTVDKKLLECEKFIKRAKAQDITSFPFKVESIGRCQWDNCKGPCLSCQGYINYVCFGWMGEYVLKKASSVNCNKILIRG